MSEAKKFYITTTLPYVNAPAHLGHALEFIRADTIARYKKLQGFEVFFNTGTDEHGQKIYREALNKNKDPKEYVDFYAGKFKEILKLLGISEDVNFTRTTDPHHVKSAQEFWKICDKNGYIYKKSYNMKYCVGCELEKTESELVGGKCPIHPNLEIEFIDEENYFFKFSAFSDKLLEFYEKNKNFVIPETRFNEIKSFVKRGLLDFSISRLKVKMPWGIDVPGDKNHIMYVWFDALVNYISAIGWPDDLKKFNKWQVETGGMVQYCGKDNLRQQSAMWQAMLMAAGLPNSKTIIIDGFVTGAGGIKMSKSLGNVVDPAEIVKEYGTDALRYYVLRELSPFEDTQCTKELFKTAYNANLANGLGNLVSRILTMTEKYKVSYIGFNLKIDYKDSNLDAFDIKKYMDSIWLKIQETDKKIQEKEPYKLFKTDFQIAKDIVCDLCGDLFIIANRLIPVMPETADKILKYLKENKKPEKPLFARKD